MGRTIAFFDFDGTITCKDSFAEFIKFSNKGTALVSGIVRSIPYWAGYKIKLLSNQLAKERVMKHFFFRKSEIEFQTLGNRFVEEILPQIIRPAALKEIARLRQSGTELVLVSASPEQWIAQWAQQQNMILISTQLEFDQQGFTGRFKGLNCHGEEKVRRIKELYDLSQYEYIYAYGDSSGDLPMLALAHRPHLRPFR